jgi:hypothetical protein
MKITLKETWFYEQKLKDVGATIESINDMFEGKRGLKSEVSKKLNIHFSSLTCAITGHANNPRNLFLIWEYLSNKPKNKENHNFKNISRVSRNLDSMLMDNFSYQEAIQILA